MIRLLLFIPIVAFVAILLRPELILGADLLNLAGFWTLVGTLFSYLGLVFSLFALLEVRTLSQRYFTKQRLPEIKKRIDVIAKDVYSFGESELTEIRTRKFMSEIPVMTRQVKKTKVSELSQVAKRLERAHEGIKKQLASGLGLKVPANDSDKFWELHGTLTELSDEIEEYIKGAIASL